MDISGHQLLGAWSNKENVLTQMYWVTAIYGLFQGFFPLKCLIQITVRHSREVGLEGNVALEGMSLQSMEAPTPGTGQQESPQWRKGVRRKSSQEKPVCTDHSPVSGGTGEGRRNQGRSWTGQVRQTCSYLSLLPTAWRNNWVSILIGNKLIFLKSTLPCPQQLVISPSLSQPRIFLNTFLLCKGWVAERELGNQARETHHNQPSLPRNTSGLSNYVILHYLCMSQSCSIFFKSYWRNTGSV